MNDFTGLATLDAAGTAPESRMTDALETRQRVQQFILADSTERSYKRSLVKGLVEGNPPFRHGDLVNAGRADQCNVNWRISEAYLAMALAIRYQMFSDTPTWAVVATEFGRGQEQSDWGSIMTEEFDTLQKSDRFFDYHIQCSQLDTVLYGMGPLTFRHPLDWRCRYTPCGSLYVPEMAASCTQEWEEAAITPWMNPHDMYLWVRDEQVATAMGYNVQAVKAAIINAYNRGRTDGRRTNWEYHQQQLKNSSFYYSTQSKAIQVGHYFFREFPTEGEEMGAITHVIVDLSMASQGKDEFLYRRTRKFKEWEQIVHPMYYDRGGGGCHHSISGMGVKMYGAMTYQNRLLCNLADKVFAPKLLFKPTSSTTGEDFQIVRFSDYGQLPAGFDVAQTPVNGFLDEGLEFNQLVSQVIASNLSQYRQELEKKDGNPMTATQVNRMASEEATMSTADVNRTYEQYDWLYAEKFRRASNLNLPKYMPGATAALAFQRRCKDRGVPMQALKMAHVTASRVAGNGNAFLRKQSLQRTMSVMGRLPEQGQENLIRDFIASENGFSLVNRYCPQRSQGALPSDQEAFATLQVVSCKDGVGPVVTGSQNHVVFAQIFLQAASQAITTLQQTGPQALSETLAFLETIGPAIGQHLALIAQDPTRADLYKTLNTEFKKMGGITDQLHKQSIALQKQQQQRQQMTQKAQQVQSGQDPETMLKTASVANDIKLKSEKTAADLRNKEAKSQLSLTTKAAQAKQNLILKDVTTAQAIRHREAMTKQSLQQKKTTAK